MKQMEKAQVLSKQMTAKAKQRSKDVLGEMDYGFVAGYLESVIVWVAAESPEALKKLEDLVNYQSKK